MKWTELRYVTAPHMDANISVWHVEMWPPIGRHLAHFKCHVSGDFTGRKKHIELSSLRQLGTPAIDATPWWLDQARFRRMTRTGPLGRRALIRRIVNYGEALSRKRKQSKKEERAPLDVMAPPFRHGTGVALMIVFTFSLLDLLNIEPLCQRSHGNFITHLVELRRSFRPVSNQVVSFVWTTICIFFFLHFHSAYSTMNHYVKPAGHVRFQVGCLPADDPRSAWRTSGRRREPEKENSFSVTEYVALHNARVADERSGRGAVRIRPICQLLRARVPDLNRGTNYLFFNSATVFESLARNGSAIFTSSASFRVVSKQITHWHRINGWLSVECLSQSILYIPRFIVKGFYLVSHILRDVVCMCHVVINHFGWKERDKTSGLSVSLVYFASSFETI